MGFQPTGQQQDIIDAALRKESFVVQAGAGTGKSTTMRLVAEAIHNASRGSARGLYLVYNKAAQKSMAGKLPPGWDALTGHSLAYRAVGHLYGARLNGAAGVQPWHIAKFLRVDPFRSSCGTLKVPAALVAGAAKRAVKRYCYSSDRLPDVQHVATPVGVDRDSVAAAEYREAVLEPARRIWLDALDPDARALKYEHDYYLKQYQLLMTDGKIQHLPYHVVVMDEGQDANGAVESIFVHQGNAQRIAVGDSAQAIYEWRGARDSLGRLERVYGAPVRWLTRSFRFGPAIAEAGNQWLKVLGTPLRIEGDPNRVSTVGAFDPTARHAVLCRTNAGVIEEVLDAMERGYPVAVAGGVNDILALVEACGKLKQGRRPTHPDLMVFDSWYRLLEYVSSEECDDGALRTVVKLVEAHGVDELARALRRCVPEPQAQVIVSTSHAAKGLEWESVRIGDDFPEPKPTPKRPDPKVEAEDARLAYVAVTRARAQLDRGGLSWVDGWV